MCDGPWLRSTSRSSGATGTSGIPARAQSVWPNVWRRRRGRMPRSRRRTREHTMADLAIEEVTVGTGPEAVPGRTVSVHYVGTLPDGTRFDASRDRGRPFSFLLGRGQVIQGWDQGVAGMRTGGVRKLVIPAELGYGDAGAPPVIPPGATLHFEVELLEVR